MVPLSASELPPSTTVLVDHTVCRCCVALRKKFKKNIVKIDMVGVSNQPENMFRHPDKLSIIIYLSSDYSLLVACPSMPTQFPRMVVL